MRDVFRQARLPPYGAVFRQKGNETPFLTRNVNARAWHLVISGDLISCSSYLSTRGQTIDLLQRGPVQDTFYQCISTFAFCFLCYILSFCASPASGGGRAERVKRQSSKCIDATSLIIRELDKELRQGSKQEKSSFDFRRGQLSWNEASGPEWLLAIPVTQRVGDLVAGTRKR